MRPARAGARDAGYVLLRLPLRGQPDLQGLAAPALSGPLPARACRWCARCATARTTTREWGKRMKGTGPYAWQIGRRFEIAARRLGFNSERTPLRTDLFVSAEEKGGQLLLL